MTAVSSKNWQDRLPDGSKSVQSVWVWRGLLFMAIIALGIVIAAFQTGRTVFAVLWLVIALGWFSISMWLWRKHVLDDNAAAQAKPSGGRNR
jgi:hypothetical protein